MRNRLLFALSLGTGVGMLSISASARTETVLPFDMPAQGLGDALRDVATRAGWELFAPGDIDSLRAPALHERLSAREAIVRLLARTHLRARFSAGAVTIRRITDAPRPGGDQPTGAQILVTGSRIHGAPPSAPVRTVTAQDIDESGQADLGEVLRSSPLNFAGGQNPGVGTSQGDDDGNVNGASSVDLLGLGPNATLTLLNGNRLSYSGINAGVDIDAIPAGAVERIEIVADGASAIYGADAVAGVVNVALRSDYQGLETEARIGGSTDGGDFQQQYSLLAGHIWARGGIMAAYTYTGNSGIAASQRDYASSMGTDASLYPSLKRHNLLLSAHQDIGSALTARIDMLYKQTRQYSVFGGTAGQSHLYGGQDSRGNNPSFTVAPTLKANLGHGWTGNLLTSYAFDRTHFISGVYAQGVQTSQGDRRYDNSASSIEINADGPVFALPAGAVRIAIGGGLRRTSLSLVAASAASTTGFDTHRYNRFGYIETFIPLLAPGQASALGRSLSITGAFRYEANSGTASAAVPKAGIIYAPVEGVTLKASWGRSFRLPTFYEQYNGYALVLLPASSYASGYPAGSTFLYLAGSNANLKPERSENWTVSGEIKPQGLPGLTATLGYFHFNYRNRIATPISSITDAFSNDLYASFLDPDPSQTFQDSLIAGANSRGLQNGTGAAYDGNTVVAVLDNRYQNVAREIYRGLTGSVRYTMVLPQGAKLGLTLDGVWIDSDRQLIAGASMVQLAGTLFNPPHIRVRGGISYSTRQFSLSGFANLASKLTDTRTSTRYSIHGPRTIDLAALFHASGGLDLGMTVNNLLNAKPPTIVTSSGYDTPFDSTNFSAIGRFISVRIRKSW